MSDIQEKLKVFHPKLDKYEASDISCQVEVPSSSSSC